ncbi:hypothetical protein OESDEN_05780, partial [Oesophagostomum dentatum]
MDYYYKNKSTNFEFFPRNDEHSDSEGQHITKDEVGKMDSYTPSTSEMTVKKEVKSEFERLSKALKRKHSDSQDQRITKDE